MSSRAASAPRKRQGQASGSRFPVMTVVIGSIVALFAVAIIVTRGQENDSASVIEQTRSVALTGEALPAFEATEGDTAIGRTAPELKGSDFEGDEVAIANDGRRKVVLFLAHWCPYCQKEVPLIGPWLAGGGLPRAVDLYSVSTSVDRSQPNYPPSDWLSSENWSAPVLADDADSSAGSGFGLTSFPYWVFIDEGGAVTARFSGQLSPQQLNGYLERLGWR